LASALLFGKADPNTSRAENHESESFPLGNIVGEESGRASALAADEIES
jgi:hypothetical protein